METRPKARSFILNPLFAALLAALLMPLATYADEIDSCEAPSFRVRWLSSNAPQLVAKAQPEGKYTITLEVPKEGESWSPPPEKIKLTYNGLDLVPLSNESTVFNLYLKDRELISTAGQIKINYKIDDNKRTPCTPHNEGIANITALPKSTIRFDMGGSYAMNADGTFTLSPELAISTLNRHSPKLSGAIDLRSTRIGKVAEEGADETNPFKAGGSTIEGRAALLVHPLGESWNNPSFSVIGGVGLRTMPKNEESKFTDTRGKHFIGLRWQTFAFVTENFENEPTDCNGYFELGYARDRFWRDSAGDEDKSLENRWFANAQLQIPGVGTKNTCWVFRGTADTAVKYKKPSEIRFSVLYSISDKAFATLFAK